MITHCSTKTYEYAQRTTSVWSLQLTSCHTDAKLKTHRIQNISHSRQPPPEHAFISTGWYSRPAKYSYTNELANTLHGWSLTRCLNFVL